ncbi:MAG TPA: hypothetical protein VHA56_04090 [Mucilaginibacter sp.]|nr:hypothetical protein [Mucilaginibacter sp.]
MNTYLINSTLCSGLLVAAYVLILKGKTTFIFNRFYLLFAVIFSLLVPFIVVNRASESVKTEALQEQLSKQPEYFIQKFASSAYNEPNVKFIDNQTHSGYFPFLCGVYGIVSLLLLVRFVKNLAEIQKAVRHNRGVPFNNSILKLVDAKIIPHTFLKYIFVSRTDYVNHLLEEDILKHELTHAKQYHSLDVISIEFVRIFFWFNPFLPLYRKFIQSNHEFLADAATVCDRPSPAEYQHLLLHKLGYVHSLPFASQFNYSLTKKRLIMMSKKTSGPSAAFAKLSIVPVMALALLLFCGKSKGQQSLSAPKQTKSQHAIAKIDQKTPKIVIPDFPSTKEGVPASLLDEYSAIETKYADLISIGKHKKISDEDHERLLDIYKQMNKKQQQSRIIRFRYFKGLLPMAIPTKSQYETWKNPRIYGVWINGHHVSNSALSKYEADDFSQFFVSRLYGVAKKDKNYKYQLDLITKAYYENYKKETLENSPKTIIEFRMPKAKG